MKACLFVFLAVLSFSCTKKTNENSDESIEPKLITIEVGPEQLIIPGTAIGGTAIEDDTSKLEVLGQPNHSDAAMGKAWMTWYGKKTDTTHNEMNVYTTYKDDELKEKVVRQIRITSPDFKTVEGINTESSFAEILKAFPNIKTVGKFDNIDTKIETTIYDDIQSGIAFEVRNPFGKSQCCAIIVHEKGKKVTDDYIHLNPYTIVL